MSTEALESFVQTMLLDHLQCIQGIHMQRLFFLPTGMRVEVDLHSRIG